MSLHPTFATTTFRISAGAIAWALHFAVIYGYTGLACARRISPAADVWLGALPYVIGGATVIAAAATVPFVIGGLRARGSPDFPAWMSAGVAALAFFGIVLEGITYLWLPTCV